MPSIKIHLEAEEYEPIQRLAKQLDMEIKDIVYTALDELMMKKEDPKIQKALQKIHQWRKQDLPTWADKAQEIHAYEGS
ncbi:MAG: hypothetical protein JKY51_07175 [Opitutaceae bacterium]|nr:hypothetical protein [Opitutaceae bacterium]